MSDFPAGRVTGEVADIGLACGGAPLLSDPAGKIALIERGICTFSEKLSRALAAGAIAGIVFNSATGGDDLLTMGGTPVAITGVFVGRTTGLDLRAAAGVAVTISSCGRSATCRGAL